MKKKFNPRIKARIRKNKQVLNKKIDNFFGWVKGAKLVELKECNVEEEQKTIKNLSKWLIIFILMRSSLKT